jgi:hypothetical protein
MDSRDEYLEPTRIGQLAMASVILAGLATLVMLYLLAPSVMGPMQSLPTLCAELDAYRRLIQKLSLALPIPGVWLALYGRRILKSGQSPPPGAWVLHRTLVKGGAHVKRVGWAIVAIGIVISVMPLYFWSEQSRQQRAAVAEVCEELR